MRVIICGGRDLDDKEFVFSQLDKINQLYDLTFIITGGARGADFWANMWAAHNHKEVRVYQADWEKLGRAAGIIRNKQMLTDAKPELVIAFEGGKGTENMVKIATKAGIPVVEIKNV